MSKRGRWLPAFTGWSRLTWVILAFGVGAAFLFQTVDVLGDGGFSNVASMAAAALAIIVWLLWFLLGSGQPWWLRLAPPAGIAVFCVVFFNLYRYEEVSGNFVPRFVPRSEAKHDLEIATARGRGRRRRRHSDHHPPTTSRSFLGPGRDLRVDHVELARDWQASPPKLLWRREIGAGWSGFAVVNGYALTMEQRGDQELVSCYDLATGEPRWAHAISARYEEAVAGVGPRATPTVHAGRVFAQGATGQLLALDGATGEPVWQKDLLAEFAMTPEEDFRDIRYGRSGSPLIVDDLVVVPAGGPSDGKTVSLVAYSQETGERVWEGGDDQISCASPTIATVAGRAPDLDRQRVERQRPRPGDGPAAVVAPTRGQDQRQRQRLERGGGRARPGLLFQGLRRGCRAHPAGAEG